MKSSNSSDTSFSCNSNVYFYLTPETEDPETLEYAEKGAVSIPYKVITNRFYDSGILAIAEDGKTATITCEPGQLVGYNDCVFVATTTGADVLPLVFDITKNGAKMAVTSTMFGVSSSGGWYTLFTPTEFDAL